MKYKKKIFVWITAVVLLLTGCGMDVSMQTSQMGEQLPTYTAEYYTLENVMDKNTECFFLTTKGFYYMLEKDGGKAIYFRDLSALEQESKMLLFFDAKNNITEFIVAPDETIVVLMSRHGVTEEGEIDYGSFAEQMLCKYEADGGLLWEQSISDNSGVAYEIHGDTQGGIYVATREAVYIYNGDGKKQGQFVASNIAGFAPLSKNEIYISDGKNTKKYTGEKLVDVMELTGYQLFQMGDSLGLYKDGYWYSHHPKQKSEPVKCINLLEYYINGMYLLQTVTDNSGKMIFLCRDGFESQDVEIITLQQEGTGKATLEIVEEHPKIQLDMAIMEAGRWNQLAIDFNSADKEAYVEVKDMLGNRSFAEAGMLIKASILADNPPDIVEVSVGITSAEYSDYVENNYLLDLTPYLENSKLFHKDDFVDWVIEDVTVDGKVYAIPAFMRMCTIICPTEFMNGKTGWTIEEFLTFMEENPNAFFRENENNDPVQRKYIILYNLLFSGMDAFVDRENGKAYFAEERFRSTLQRINALEFSQVKDSLKDRVYSGENVGELYCQIYDNRSLANVEWTISHGKGGTMMGFPTAETVEGAIEGKGGVNLVYYDGMLGIPATSEHPDEAWRVIERFLMQRAIRGEQEWFTAAFSTGKEALEAALKKGTGENWQEEMPEGEYYSLQAEYGKNYTFRITDAQVEKIRNGLENSMWLDGDTDFMVTTITEEAMAYFEGQKSLDDAVDVIQNRIQLYLDEQG